MTIETYKITGIINKFDFNGEAGDDGTAWRTTPGGLVFISPDGTSKNATPVYLGGPGHNDQLDITNTIDQFHARVFSLYFAYWNRSEITLTVFANVYNNNDITIWSIDSWPTSS